MMGLDDPAEPFPPDMARVSEGSFGRLLRSVAALGVRAAEDEAGLMQDALFAWAHVHGLAVMFTQQTLAPFAVAPEEELNLARTHCTRLLTALGYPPPR